MVVNTIGWPLTQLVGWSRKSVVAMILLLDIALMGNGLARDNMFECNDVRTTCVQAISNLWAY